MKSITALLLLGLLLLLLPPPAFADIVTYEPTFTTHISSEQALSPFTNHVVEAQFNVENNGSGQQSVTTVMQVINSEGYAVFMNQTVDVVIDAGEIKPLSITWKPEREGKYRVDIFVLGISSFDSYTYIKTEQSGGLGTYLYVSRQSENAPLAFALLEGCEQGNTEICTEFVKSALKVNYENCQDYTLFGLQQYVPPICNDPRLEKYA